MGKVLVRGTGKGISFARQFMNQPNEIRSALLKGEAAEVSEGDLKFLRSYEIVNKAQVEDSPSAPADEEPENPPEEDFYEVSESDAESSNEEDTQEAASDPKPKHKKKRKRNF